MTNNVLISSCRWMRPLHRSR